MTLLVEQNQIQVRTPAKLILSGEHSVLYGSPAIAMAINCHAETRVFWQPEHHSIVFHLLNLDYTAAITLKKLRALKQRIQNKYNKFLNGECTIGEVLQRSIELLQYALIFLIDKLHIILPRGLGVSTQSDIPIGCGMGSSAATIISIIHAINNFLNLGIKPDSYLQLGREAENLQHGYSSGLDLHLALHGGCKKFSSGEITELATPKVPLYLINTGKPKSTTGECVIHAAKHLNNNQVLIDDFTAITNAMETALKDNDPTAVQQYIRANHQLLVKIGVVPEKIQCFIAEIEQQGAAAKICGGGAVTGQKAGAILVATNHDITPLTTKYGYKISPAQANNCGSQIV